MPKLTSWQLFILMLVALGVLAGAAYLDHTYLQILIGVLLSVLGVFVHINGVNLGVPLSPVVAAQAAAVASAAPAAAPEPLIVETPA